MLVSKGKRWRLWEKTEEKRFFKTYYIFLIAYDLTRLVSMGYQYEIYPDSLTLQKCYSWNTLKFFVNNNRREKWGIRKNIREIHPTDSKSRNLLQLTDILLGCGVRKAKAYLIDTSPKSSIANMLSDCDRLKVVGFTPPYLHRSRIIPPRTPQH
jgi:hypothetical protein